MGLLILVGALALLSILAWFFGADSRPGPDDHRPFWP